MIDFRIIKTTVDLENALRIRREVFVEEHNVKMLIGQYEI